MCGIFGIADIDGRISKQQDKLDAISYRGPDSSATQSFHGKVLFSHARLSIIDTSNRASQPFTSTECQMTIVFNGEIYNHKELRKKLEGEYFFQTDSDTEVLLYMFHKFGADFSKYVLGMFAFAIFDHKKNKVSLFRDHQGIKPLIYSVTKNSLVFASELKAVTLSLKASGHTLKIREELLPILFTLGYLPPEETIFQNIYKLPAGSYLEYSLNDGAIKRGILNTYSSESTNSSLAGLFAETVVDHLVADVPVGLLFSGGIDSSLIAAVLSSKGVSMNAYTVLLPHKTEDREMSRKISRHFGMKQRELHFADEDFLHSLELVMGRIDEPLYDSSILPTYFVSAVASKDVKVVLSGEGGDELFAGYPRHLVMSNQTKGGTNISLLEETYSRLPEFRGKKRFFSPFFKHFSDYYSYYLFDQSLSSESKAWSQVKSQFVQANLDWLTLDRCWYLQSDLLRKIDLGTSYASIEGRVPFLDQRIVDSVQGKGREWLLSSGELKFQEKKLLRDYLPPDLTQRGKSGFGIDLKSYFERLPLLSAYYTDASDRLDKIEPVRHARNFSSPRPLRFQRMYLDIVVHNVLLNCGYYE